MSDNPIPVPIKAQPRTTFNPSDFIAIEHLEELLDQQEGVAGFELLADTRILTIKSRGKDKHGKRSEWISGPGIFDISSENKQILFVAKKEITFKCFMTDGITVSVITDTYKDPIFQVVLNYSGKYSKCCGITSSTGKEIGFVKKEEIFNDGFILQNELDNSSFKVTLVKFDGEGFVYDVWDGPTLVAGLSSENSVLTVYSAGSLNVSTKVILLGFAFYLDGLAQGDNRMFHFF